VNLSRRFLLHLYLIFVIVFACTLSLGSGVVQASSSQNAIDTGVCVCSCGETHALTSSSAADEDDDIENMPFPGYGGTPIKRPYKYYMAGSAGSYGRDSDRESERRNMILKYIIANPGSTISEISRNLSINMGTVTYHLFRLEDYDKIVLDKAQSGKFVRAYQKVSRFDERNKQIISLLRNEASVRIVHEIARSPGITNQTLSEQLGLHKSTVNWHLHRFLDNGIIEVSQDGRMKRCYLREDVRSHMLAMHAANGILPSSKIER
jgi:DNA-binding transcriptional ArsR family regulator